MTDNLNSGTFKTTSFVFIFRKNREYSIEVTRMPILSSPFEKKYIHNMVNLEIKHFFICWTKLNTHQIKTSFS